jgi:hypothetical protein
MTKFHVTTMEQNSPEGHEPSGEWAFNTHSVTGVY